MGLVERAGQALLDYRFTLEAQPQNGILENAGILIVFPLAMDLFLWSCFLIRKQVIHRRLLHSLSFSEKRYHHDCVPSTTVMHSQ